MAAKSHSENAENTKVLGYPWTRKDTEEQNAKNIAGKRTDYTGAK